MFSVNALDQKVKNGHIEVSENTMYIASSVDIDEIKLHLDLNICDEVKRKKLLSALTCFDKDEFFNGHKLLDELLKNSDREAFFIASLFSKPNESLAEFEKRHLIYLKKSFTTESVGILLTINYLLYTLNNRKSSETN